MPCQICVIHLKFQNHICEYKGHLLNNLGESPCWNHFLGKPTNTAAIMATAPDDVSRFILQLKATLEGRLKISAIYYILSVVDTSKYTKYIIYIYEHIYIYILYKFWYYLSHYSLHISFCLYISLLHICMQTFCFLTLMLTTTKGKGPRQGVSMPQTIWVVSWTQTTESLQQNQINLMLANWLLFTNIKRN